VIQDLFCVLGHQNQNFLCFFIVFEDEQSLTFIIQIFLFSCLFLLVLVLSCIVSACFSSAACVVSLKSYVTLLTTKFLPSLYIHYFTFFLYKYKSLLFNNYFTLKMGCQITIYVSKNRLLELKSFNWIIFFYTNKYR